MKLFKISFAALFLIIAACTPTAKIGNDVLVAPDTENRDLDTLFVTASREKEETPVYKLPVYNPSHTRVNDLLHTKLDVRFDWSKQHLNGKATLTLKPHFYKTNKLTLDAKGFDIHKVALVQNGKMSELQYDYDNKQLFITLDKSYESSENYTVYVEYTSKPNDLIVKGSAAITADKGLYFINPLKEDPNKPQQIWTQGETESSSCWFPTIDKPNERTTQELAMTVQDRFQTLSNGSLKSSVKNSDGTRTDTWVMDKPHAPYLFMMTVGEFAIEKETWKGKELSYWVEPKYKAAAKNIYSNTPEMLDFFSELLDYDYPWDKYAQVSVRDYVSGAMENTSAVIFGEFVQKSNRELIDNHNERIVAHELIHHWFGDLVTCESWANLPLNESFANYGEYLWFEHKYGNDAADYHLMNEMGGYLGSARRGSIHDLIHFGYGDKEQMFDSHSYNKGGTILHMLRNIIGDEAFFQSLTKYLKDNEYSDVESHELRLAVEDVTGKDMNWFFNQWFFEAGHPQLDIEYGYDAAKKMATISVKQTQDPEKMPAIFQLPVEVDVYTANGKERHQIMMTEREQVFELPTSSQPKLVNFDAEKVLLCEKKENKTAEELVFQFENAPKFLDRYEALAGLRKADSTIATPVYEAALNDKFWVIRRMGLDMIKLREGSNLIATIKKLALSDEHSQVRAAAIEKLGELGDPKYAATAQQILDKELAYPVIGAALEVLSSSSPNDALTYAKKLEKESNTRIVSTISKIYAAKGDASNLTFFAAKAPSMTGFYTTTFFDNYTKLLQKADDATIKSTLGTFKSVATNMDKSGWYRYGSARGVYNVLNFTRGAIKAAGEENAANYKALETLATTYLEEIKEKEESGQLKRLYSNWK